ncbi:MAG: antibiotic biosynthesis monooxygenase [Trueperaceae bacterium]
MTVLESHVAADKWEAIGGGVEAARNRLPPQMVRTYLAQSTSDKTLWRIVSVWKSREALEEYQRSTETPGGVLLFRNVGAEPTLAVFDVVVHAGADTPR